MMTSTWFYGFRGAKFTTTGSTAARIACRLYALPCSERSLTRAQGLFSSCSRGNHSGAPVSS